MSSRLSAAARALAIALPGFALAAWYEWHAVRAGGTGFPLDDSWIHAQFARNLATGQGFSYTGGTWVSGSTAPAWSCLLALGYAITRHVVLAAVLLGLVLQCLAALFSARAAETMGVPRSVAWVAGVMAGVTPVLVWGAVSGMEVPLAAALTIAGFQLYLDGRQSSRIRRLGGIAIIGLSTLARPENLALGAIVAVSELIGRDSFPRRLAHAATAAGIVVIAFAPLVLFSYSTIGRPLPTTFYAKSGPGLVSAVETRDASMARRDLLTFGPRALRGFALILGDQFSWAAWMMSFGLIGLSKPRARRPAALIIAILIIVPFAMGATAPQRLKPDNVRYAAQLLVLVPPLVTAGLWHGLRRARAVAVLGSIACALTIVRAEAGARPYAIAVKNIRELQVVAAQWLAANTPPDAVVAVNDVGAAAYFSGRRILDLEGLVSPEVLAYRSLPDRGLRVVEKEHPDYIMIFPAWYPAISRSPAFREIHRTSISDNEISAGNTLIVYQTPWTRP